MRTWGLLLGLLLSGSPACTGDQILIGRDRDEQGGFDAGTEAAADHAVPEASVIVDTGSEQDPTWAEPFGACGDLIAAACPAATQPSLVPRVLFDAATLGPGHRIVDTDGRHVWIDKDVSGVHDTLFVRVNPYGGEPAFETYPLSSATPLQPVAAAGRLGLACSATACSLHLWDTEMQRVDGDELARNTNPFAIAVATPAEYGLQAGVYAAGEGVYLFKAGTWSTEIAPEAGVHWRALAAGGYEGNEIRAVVGDNGLVRIKYGDLPWKDIIVGTSASLTAVSVSGLRVLIGADNGMLIRVEKGQIDRCVTGAGIASIHLDPSNFGRLQVVGANSDGLGFEYPLGGQGCFTPGPPGILKARIFYCGAMSNAVYQTDTVLWGTHFCAVD